MSMKSILLDTITFDTLVARPDTLPVNVRAIIEKADQVVLCQISLYEISKHVQSGQIQIDQPFATFYKAAIRAFGITLIDTQWKALEYLATFDNLLIEKPWSRLENGKTVTGVKQEPHKDPFDRIIIAHAITLGIPVVSPDTLFPHYKPLGLNVIWK